MSDKTTLQHKLTEFEQALELLDLARDERNRVEGALHGLTAVVAQLPESEETPAAEPTFDTPAETVAPESATVEEQPAPVADEAVDTPQSEPVETAPAGGERPGVSDIVG